MSPIAHNLAATPRRMPWHCRNCRPVLASRDPPHKVDIKSCARNCAPSITTRMLTQLRVWPRSSRRASRRYASRVAASATRRKVARSA
jgi:hypothetical protein